MNLVREDEKKGRNLAESGIPFLAGQAHKYEYGRKYVVRNPSTEKAKLERRGAVTAPTFCGLPALSVRLSACSSFSSSCVPTVG